MTNDDIQLTLDTIPLALANLKVRYSSIMEANNAFIVNVNDIAYGLLCQELPMIYIIRRCSPEFHLPQKYGVKELFETINAVNSVDHQVKVVYAEDGFLEFRLYQTEENYTSFCKHFFDYIKQINDAVEYFDKVKKMRYEDGPANPMSLYLGHMLDVEDEMYDEERLLS